MKTFNVGCLSVKVVLLILKTNFQYQRTDYLLSQNKFTTIWMPLFKTVAQTIVEDVGMKPIIFHKYNT